jgi:hypothetical protein
MEVANSSREARENREGIKDRAVRIYAAENQSQREFRIP